MNDIERFINLPEKRARSEVRAYGIDLGTTNSTVAEVSWVPGQAPVCRIMEIEQPTDMGSYTAPLVPSVVGILPDGRVWVGEGAKRIRATMQKYGLVVEKNLFYETKNDIGLKKTYYRAPSEFNHASKIAGCILAFLYSALSSTRDGELGGVSVSIPASFQLNQIQDTITALSYAGLDPDDCSLIDEPTAALIEYMMANGPEKVLKGNGPAVCLVFDFGGGTCDVSVMEIDTNEKTHRLSLSQLSISRYHRLGGGDIDAAIVHECLIPDMLRENHLDPLDLTWGEKKKVLEPQLLSTSESLKISLCKEISRLKMFGQYKDDERDNVVARLPFVKCMLGSRDLMLERPSLSARRFEEVLEDFLDTEHLYMRETEYRLTQSIFAPIQDALDKAGKSPRDVDVCLLVGGSSVVPQVVDALKEYFGKDAIATFKDHESSQTAVAKGAAWNAFFRTISGKPFIQSILHDGISLVTSTGNPFLLVPPKAALPYPDSGDFNQIRLEVPRDRILTDQLMFELVSDTDRQCFFKEIWTLPETALPGEEIVMEYRITSEKRFESKAFLSRVPDQLFECVIDNPMVNVYNPGSIRLKIEEAEEGLRMKGGGSAEDRDTFVQIARWYAELNQKERALDLLRTALRKFRKPDEEILNLQGIYFGELGDHEKEEKSYREADRVSRSWSGPMFNLALSYHKRGMHEEALKTLGKSIEKYGEDGPELSLKAMCLESMGRKDEAQRSAVAAMKYYGPVTSLSDFELGWYHYTAKYLGDTEASKKIEQEKIRRRKLSGTSDVQDVPRPDLKGDLVVREEV